MKLPDGTRADLGNKLEDYVLNSLHHEGRHKARVFERVLGITAANADILGRALLHAAEHSDQAVSKGNNGYGDVFVLRAPISTRVGTATVMSAWIIRNGEDFPRLTTCYIL